MLVLCRSLLVHDSAVISLISAAHTCAPTIVITEKAAEMILEDLEKS
jgi:hypothetical protein